MSHFTYPNISPPINFYRLPWSQRSVRRRRFRRAVTSLRPEAPPVAVLQNQGAGVIGVSLVINLN